MSKVLKSHGQQLVNECPEVKSMGDNTALRKVSKIVADDNGHLCCHMALEPIIDDDNITAEDLSLSNVIRSGSIGLLKPIKPISPSALGVTDSVAAALGALDVNNIVETSNN